MTPLQIVQLRAPCYKPASAQVYGLLELAESQIGADAYGTLRNTAVALQALHWLTLQERGKAGASGNIVSETEGDLSRTYAQTATTSDLSTTIYGQELDALGKKGSLSFVNRRFGTFP